MDADTLHWCEGECRKEAQRWRLTGQKHPEDSDSRGRCFARARSLHLMAERFAFKRTGGFPGLLRNDAALSADHKTEGQGGAAI